MVTVMPSRNGTLLWGGMMVGAGVSCVFLETQSEAVPDAVDLVLHQAMAGIDLAGTSVEIGDGSPWPHGTAGGPDRFGIGIEEFTLPVIRRTQDEGPRQVGAVALHLRGQIDDDEVSPLQRLGALASMQHAGLDADVHPDGGARLGGPGAHHRGQRFGGDLMGGDAFAQQLTRAVHAQAGDALSLGHERQLTGILHGRGETWEGPHDGPAAVSLVGDPGLDRPGRVSRRRRTP